MKKYLSLMLALALALMLAACAPGQAPEAQSEPSDTDFSYQGAVVSMGSMAEDAVKALGTPDSVSAQPSCLAQGAMDKTYTYPGFYFSTSPDEKGRDRIYSLELTDETVSTPRGVKLGSTEAEVKAAYPDGSWCEEFCYLDRENTSLTIQLQDGKVCSIRYFYLGSASPCGNPCAAGALPPC